MMFRWYRSGSLFGIRYWMRRGEEIPVHVHAEAEFEHNIMVLRGTVRLQIEGRASMLTEGQILDFDGAKPHSIMCMSDAAMTVHLFLHGMPKGYDQLPESEHQGSL